MKAKIFSNNHLIGTTDLQVGDKSMGGIFGDFVPTEYYFDKIQKCVWEFWQTTTPDYQKWHASRFNVQLENGLFLFPQGGYTIDDIEELPDEPKRIDLAGVNPKIIEDYFLTDPPRPFIEEPWEVLQIEQKIMFEDELKKELGIGKKSFLSFLNNKSKHEIFESEFSAFCYDERNGNVLFEVIKSKVDKQFALVELTWSGRRGKKGKPNTIFYADYDEFKHSKMYPDKAEWED